MLQSDGELKFQARKGARIKKIEQCYQTLLFPVGGASGHETRFKAEEVRQAHVTNAPRAH